MSTFDTTQHPRNHPTGKSRFSDKIPGSPEGSVELGVADRPVREVIDAVLKNRATVACHPAGLVETRAALSNRYGEAGYGFRRVKLSWKSVPAGSKNRNLDVVGPDDGRPLVIDITSGGPRLNIKSGNVIVNVSTSYGIGISVEDGATVLIAAGKGQKVSTVAAPGSVVDFYAEPGSLGFQSIAEGADFTFHGDETRISFTRDYDEASDTFIERVKRA